MSRPSITITITITITTHVCAQAPLITEIAHCRRLSTLESRMFILSRPSRLIFGKGVWVGGWVPGGHFMIPKLQTYQQHRFLHFAEIQHGNAEHFRNAVQLFPGLWSIVKICLAYLETHRKICSPPSCTVHRLMCLKNTSEVDLVGALDLMHVPNLMHLSAPPDRPAQLICSLPHPMHSTPQFCKNLSKH